MAGALLFCAAFLVFILLMAWFVVHFERVDQIRREQLNQEFSDTSADVVEAAATSPPGIVGTRKHKAVQPIGYPAAIPVLHPFLPATFAVSVDFAK